MGPSGFFPGRAVTASAGAQACGCYYECFIARNIAHGYESKYCCAQREEAGHSEKGIFAQLGSPLEKIYCEYSLVSYDDEGVEVA